MFPQLQQQPLPLLSQKQPLTQPGLSGFKNLSSTSLTEAQDSFLARGPNFVIVLLDSPKGEYVKAVVVSLSKNSTPNCGRTQGRNQQGSKAFFPHQTQHHQGGGQMILRKDSSWVIHTVDKMVAIVVLDKQDYITKAEDLPGKKCHLQNLASRPNNKQKKRFINILKTINTGRPRGQHLQNDYILQEWGLLPSSMGYPKFTNRTPLLTHSFHQAYS